MAEKSIVVDGLAKNYGDFWALNGISFDVSPGEIVGFLGPNGAGKTTTMKILTCFMAAAKGSAKVAGLDVYADSEKVRQKIGYLPESVPLYDDMMVYDYLRFISEIRGVESGKRHDAIKRAVELTGLTPMITKNIRELSKGYRQRVGLAQAIIHEPEVVILDEPTSGLDPNQIIEIRDLIKEIGRTKTVVFSTHILQEVAAVCDRIIVIDKGTLIADGTVEELSALVAGDEQRLIVTANGKSTTASRLGGLPGVTKVTEVKQGDDVQYSLECRDLGPARAAVFQIAADIGLQEVKQHQPTLEDIFRALTSGATVRERHPTRPYRPAEPAPKSEEEE